MRRKRAHLAAIIRLALILIWLASSAEPFAAGSVSAAPQRAYPSSPASSPGATSWVYQTVDSGEMPSLAVASLSGKAFLSYFDRVNLDLRTAFHVYSGGNCGTGNAWECATIDSPGSVGEDSSIATDPLTGQPAIAYSDYTNKAIKFAQYSCNNNLCIWVKSTVDGVANQNFYQPSAQFDSLGNAHIAYTRVQPSAALKYASYLGNGTGNCGPSLNWQCDVVDSGGGVASYLSLDIDGSNTPHIAYFDDVSGTLKYASYVVSGGAGCAGSSVSGAWQCDIIDGNGVGTTHTVGAFVSLYVAKSGNPNPQMAYYDGDSQSLKYAMYGAQSANCGPAGAPGHVWKCSTIDHMGDAPYPTIALSADGTGTPFIAYWNFSDHANAILKLATPNLFGNCGPGLFPGWSCTTIDNGFVGLGFHDVGVYPRIALNSAGLLRIAYTDNTAGNVRYAEQILKSFMPFVSK